MTRSSVSQWHRETAVEHFTLHVQRSANWTSGRLPETAECSQLAYFRSTSDVLSVVIIYNTFKTFFHVQFFVFLPTTKSALSLSINIHWLSTFKRWPTITTALLVHQHTNDKFKWFNDNNGSLSCHMFTLCLYTKSQRNGCVGRWLVTCSLCL